MAQDIGTIGNNYGGLTVKKVGDKFFWTIQDWNECCRWEEIPQGLYIALMAFNEGREVPVVSDLTADINRLREALEWYSEKVENCAKLPGIQEGDAARSALSHDRGRRARAALNPVDQDGEA